MTYSLVFVAGFIAYAGILSMTGRSAKVVRVIGGGSAYLFFAALLVSPLFWSADFTSEFRNMVKADDIYFVYFFVCYALSIVPGALMFKRKYLPGLKKLGYFAKRGGR
ncbi:hypothetical protein DI392_13885 [Vibrio albus]|uniref:Uncharacterized protein n=4 Tax=Vibrio TaxID=662 RepID=A0A1P8DPM9_VIBAL|nr:hypothetical protein [Vibrio alginolyticus]APU91081.1 hypothetical protein [Vibrio alginolyticus]APU91307.1 hypothetical protein [Vibrio parahaemolyticus]AVF73863.1 hypothetical protein AL539_08660 [Vibrio alginolyticus]PWI32901.1 hypothetical protein DI392_13885 [Vibrio albus]